MPTKKVFVKSDAKDLLAASDKSVNAILDNCSTTIIFAENAGSGKGKSFLPEATKKHAWPAGQSMDVTCPHCAGLMATQITVVREDDLPVRPEDCEACNAEFEVYPDGQTVLLSAPHSGPPTERGLEAIKFFESVTFDPNGASDWPFTTEVETLVTVAWLREFEDGTRQFMDADQDPPQVYSPRLDPEALELFCEANIEKYQAFYDMHEAALDRRESVPLTPFW